MRAWLCAAAIGLPLLGGCETLDTTWADETVPLISEDGIEVYYDHMVDSFDGSSWSQFKASNGSEDEFCVRVSLDEGSRTNGHRMGGIYKLAPGEAVDIGYIQDPSDWHVQTRTWSPDWDGACGAPPS